MSIDTHAQFTDDDVHAHTHNGFYVERNRSNVDDEHAYACITIHIHSMRFHFAQEYTDSVRLYTAYSKIFSTSTISKTMIFEYCSLQFNRKSN